MQEAVSDPPIQTGLVIQYRKSLTAPARWPNASLVHRYGPPSCGNAVPSSANSSAWGTKKTTANTIIQVKASPPLLATEAIVSTPTIVQIRKNRMSKRPKCRCSLRLSSSAASVMGTPGASAMSDPPFSRCRDPPGTHLGVSMTITRNKDISPVLPVYITVMIPSVIGRPTEGIALADEE